jgi:hypothetical protein
MWVWIGNGDAVDLGRNRNAAVCVGVGLDGMGDISALMR